MELISVVVPVYKVEPYLARCIESILGQTYSRFELILIDDGSPDKCGEICDDYASIDERIKVIHQENAGVSVARNIGIEYVLNNNKSEWISFIDSDDWVHPQYLEKLFLAVCEKKALLSVCQYLKTDKDKIAKKNQKTSIEDVSPEKYLRKSYMASDVVWGKLYHKSLFTGVRFPIGKIREDAFVTWKILFQFEEIPFVKEELYFYFCRTTSIIHSMWTPEHLVVMQALDEKLLFFNNKGLKKAYIRTIDEYINFLLQAIENINRYYPERKDVKDLRRKLHRLYTCNKSELKAPYMRRLHIYNMILPLKLNIIPFWIRKKRHFKEIYAEDGIVGIVNKIKEKILRK